MSKINEKDFIETYEKAYFKGNSKPDGIPKLNQTSCETEKNIESLLKRDKYELKDLIYIVGWKAGTLDENTGKPREYNGNYVNGYGKPIEEKALNMYLEKFTTTTAKVQEIRQKIENKNTLPPDVYEDMLQDVPTNFGCVYILNLLSFISKGEMPIYDQFAHRAVKALFISTYLTKDDPNTNPYKIKPDQIFIGAAPSKTDTKTVIKMYNEYLWLLNIVFGQKNICRCLDRALWVYGHYKNP